MIVSMSQNPSPESSMTIDELKSELDIRGIDYSDCVSKGELLFRLQSARTLGKAKPEIVDQFNEFEQELDVNVFDTEEVKQVTAKDGSLPGGLSPEMMKALGSDPEIMRILKDPKMQDIMKAVMENGPEAMKKYMYDSG